MVCARSNRSAYVAWARADSALRADESSSSADVAAAMAAGASPDTSATALVSSHNPSVNQPVVVTIGRPCASAAMTLVRRVLTPSGYGCTMTSQAAM